MPQYKVTAHPIDRENAYTLRAWTIVTADTPAMARDIARPMLSADFVGEPFRIVRTERRRDLVNPTFTRAASFDGPVDFGIECDAVCGACGGPVTGLGTLGRRVWFRCRDCGLDGSVLTGEPETTVTHNADGSTTYANTAPCNATPERNDVPSYACM